MVLRRMSLLGLTVGTINEAVQVGSCHGNQKVSRQLLSRELDLQISALHTLPNVDCKQQFELLAIGCKTPGKLHPRSR